MNHQLKTFVICLSFLATTVSGRAGKDEPKYIYSSIPAELRENVNAVYWEDKNDFTILSRSRARYKVLQAITILNNNSKDLATVYVHYDKNTTVVSLSGTIYDHNGEVIRKIKAKDIRDQSAYDGYSLYTDNRYKSMDMTYNVYPYTIEYEYELSYDYLYGIPDFVLIPDEKISVLNAAYAVTYPKSLKPRFQPRNVSAEPEVTTVKEYETTSWKFKNVKPIQWEPFSPSHAEVVPMIKVAPSLFEYDGYEGSMASWDEFANWISLLNKDRNKLPEPAKENIRKMTAKATSLEDKIRILYEHLQNKTRYVNIALGIGGLQPFEAAVVDQNGYGDCKALSNYMVSMLDVINIKSHYVLVDAGPNPRMLSPDFPDHVFNHAIVCVPLEKDTLWLECTSQTTAAGFMGNFTGNRKALAITDHGAAIVNTPSYSEKENLQVRSAVVSVDMNGNAKAKVVTRYTGQQYENDGLDDVSMEGYEMQKKWVQDNTDIPAFDVNQFTITNEKSRIPSASVKLDLTINRFASVSGKRLFLTPNLMNRTTYIPEKVESRKTDVVVKLAYTDIDSIHFEIPEGIYPEFLPQPTKISSPYGEYESSFKFDNGKVLYVRRVVRKNGRFPADSYPKMIEYYKAITKADNMKIVFLNKT